MANRDNAEIGNKAERAFSNHVRNSEALQTAIRRKFKIQGDFLESHPTGPNQRKSDVLILFKNSNPVGANIKVGKAGFNQVTRGTLQNISTKVGFSDSTIRALETGIDNYRLGREKILIEERFRTSVAQDLTGIGYRMFESIFRGRGNDIAKILVLHDRNSGIWNLYDLETVILQASQLPITFSKHGIIHFGNVLSLQRKGGDGNVTRVPKADIRHPGNNLQFKMKICDYIASNEPFYRFD
jgi:hypothetical protein